MTKPIKVLVANRGEVACRILRCLRAQNIASVAVYTPPDARALHVTLADEAIALTEPDGYRDGEALLAAARRTGAVAVHPGYGFLSQSPAFVRACDAAGVTFVGPTAASMEQVGDKRAARLLAQQLGIPVVPGAEAIDSAEAVHAFAAQAGFPLLIKAAAAGGGRGLRRVGTAAEIDAAVASASREVQGSVGDGRLLVERWLTSVRHIEVQIVGDGSRACALGDRECSLQRRFQKVVEEAPAPSLQPATRRALHAAAERLLAAAHYTGAGTVEFLLQDDGTFFFLEVNPRLQVEHPVTEVTSQIDLVAMQLRIALGQQSLAAFVAPAVRGAAIEVRLNAEDPGHNFVPATGELVLVHWPHGPGLRVDAGVAEGSRVTPHYDALLAKMVAWGEDRDSARRSLCQALDETVLLGVAHNQAFLRHVLTSEAFCTARTYTTTLEAMAVPAHPQVPAFVVQQVARAAAAMAQPAPVARGISALRADRVPALAATDGWRGP